MDRAQPLALLFRKRKEAAPLPASRLPSSVVVANVLFPDPLIGRHARAMAEYLSISFTELFKAHLLDVHIPNILMGIVASIEVPLITILSRRIGATQSEVAKFVLVSSLSRTALDLPCGIVAEYVGVRNMMVLCLLLNAAAAIIGLSIDNYWTLGLYAFLSGISLGGFFLSRHIFVAGISSKRYRGTLMAFLSGLLRWSHVIGPSMTGIVADRTGDVRYAFIIAAVSSLAAFMSLCIASCSTSYQQVSARSWSTNAHTPLLVTPMPSVSDEEDAATAPPVIGDESIPRGPAPTPDEAVAYTVHPSMAAGEEHNFRLSALFYTVLDCWPVIWRLGVYVIFFGAVRANRKLMLSLAAMRENLDDSELAYILSCSFAFSALLFPLGGIVMDLLGRQFAMVPVAVALSINFMVLPWCRSTTALYAVAAGFGIADALGCGLVMTLTADRAPRVYGAPFFGIMRTLADSGHVVGAGGVSFTISRLGFAPTCYIVAAVGLFTAVWGVYGVTKDVDVPKMSRPIRSSTRRGGPHTQLETLPEVPLPQTRGQERVPSACRYGSV